MVIRGLDAILLNFFRQFCMIRLFVFTTNMEYTKTNELDGGPHSQKTNNGKSKKSILLNYGIRDNITDAGNILSDKIELRKGMTEYSARKLTFNFTYAGSCGLFKRVVWFVCGPVRTYMYGYRLRMPL